MSVHETARLRISALSASTTASQRDCQHKLLEGQESLSTHCSKVRPSARDSSSARCTHSFAFATAMRELPAMLRATAVAVCMRSAAGTTRLTRPRLSASAASILRRHFQVSRVG